MRLPDLLVAALCLWAAPIASWAAVVTGANMNGEYLLAPTPKGNTTWSTEFKDYPGGVAGFTVYAGPITSTYGEVFWKALPEVALPDDCLL